MRVHGWPGKMALLLLTQIYLQISGQIDHDAASILNVRSLRWPRPLPSRHYGHSVSSSALHVHLVRF